MAVGFFFILFGLLLVLGMEIGIPHEQLHCRHRGGDLCLRY